MKPPAPALHYHQRTKHAFQRYARSQGYLDWDSQPDPFRRFEGAPLVRLHLMGDGPARSYDELSAPGPAVAQPVCLESISAFFELSLAISAWKESGGTRWALRINPSSGNLHPTEGYLVAGPIEGLRDAPAVYHYAPKEHGLECRTEFAVDIWQGMMKGFPEGTFLVGLSSVHWREAWKYGERAYRYCQHDTGHALAALSVSAAVQGWWASLVDGASDAEMAMLLGLEREADFQQAEREHADLLIAVGPVPRSGDPPQPHCLPQDALASVAAGTWRGKANRLSTDHVDWEVIDAVADACAKRPTPRAEVSRVCHEFGPLLAADRPTVPATTIIRRRRSAVAMDGRTGMTAGQFYLMLDRVLPRMDHIPWSTLGPPICVHLGLFVHRVDGLAPGLYCLVRSPDRLLSLRDAMRDAFGWAKPAGCPASLSLYLLAEGDYRAIAWRVSCEQQIAGAGAFSCAMIAEFEPRLREHGGWFYRRLFWETGLVGQILYLEAEAAGLRGTGIGCYFDDPVHGVFGLRDAAYQSLYHFTVGGPVEDTRLTTLPPYPTGPGAHDPT